MKKINIERISANPDRQAVVQEKATLANADQGSTAMNFLQLLQLMAAKGQGCKTGDHSGLTQSGQFDSCLDQAANMVNYDASDELITDEQALQLLAALLGSVEGLNNQNMPEEWRNLTNKAVGKDYFSSPVESNSAVLQELFLGLKDGTNKFNGKLDYQDVQLALQELRQSGVLTTDALTNSINTLDKPQETAMQIWQLLANKLNSINSRAMKNLPGSSIDPEKVNTTEMQLSQKSVVDAKTTTTMQELRQQLAGQEMDRPKTVEQYLPNSWRGKFTLAEDGKSNWEYRGNGLIRTNPGDVSGNTTNLQEAGNIAKYGKNVPTAKAAQENNGQAPINLSSIAQTMAKTAGGEAIPATRTAENNIPMQLADTIRSNVTKDGLGQTHVRLQLQPENLGEVIIRLSYRDGNITAQFQAASEQVKHIIESSLAQLRETLSGFQLNLQSASVSVGDEGDSNNLGQEWNKEQQQQQYNSKQTHSFDNHSDADMEDAEMTNPALQDNNNDRNELNYFV